MTFLRSLAYAAWFYGSLGFVGLGWLPVAAFSPGATRHAMRSWASAQRWGMRWICGARTEFRGLEHIPPGACVVAMKHQSTYDTIMPFKFLKDPAFILKQELLKTPIFGLYASRAKMIAIDRGGHAKTLRKMLVDTKVQADRGRPIVIYPEGTRQEVDAPTDLKPGAYAIYRALEVPCVPMALNTGLCWQGSGFKRLPGLMVFEALPAIEPGLSREDFTRRLHDALEPATKRLVAEGRRAQGK
jgi:1-acyl-sn-glycerol-3-phosphate acyltransferase